jgi:hypothetical protein
VVSGSSCAKTGVALSNSAVETAVSVTTSATNTLNTRITTPAV